MNRKLAVTAIGLFIGMSTTLSAFGDASPDLRGLGATTTASQPAISLAVPSIANGSSNNPSTDNTPTNLPGAENGSGNSPGADNTPTNLPGVKGAANVAGAKNSSLPGSIVNKVGRAIIALPATLVGTPVALVRRAKNETVDGITDLVGTHRNPLLLAPATALSVPFGIAAGVIQAPFCSFADAYREAPDHPFSKEALSLGEIKF